MPESLSVGQGGWVRFESEQLSPSVFLRFEDRGGRLVPVDLFLPGDPITGQLIRDLPLRTIEAWVNDAAVAPEVRMSLRFPGVQLRTAASHFGRSSIGKDDSWLARMLKSQIATSDEPRVKPRPLSSGRRSAHTASEVPADARLRVPEGTGDKGDDFYRQVAAVYESLARQSKKPGAAIADANGVKVTTAHRWVRVARDRGFLPPATKGRAG